MAFVFGLCLGIESGNVEGIPG